MPFVPSVVATLAARAPDILVLPARSAWHAFGQSEGTSLIELSQAGSFFECRVTDNGSARANLQPGQGLKLVDALAKSLRGKVVQQFGPPATTTLIVFPRRS